MMRVTQTVTMKVVAIVILSLMKKGRIADKVERVVMIAIVNRVKVNQNHRN
jgi:hypothetical protein